MERYRFIDSDSHVFEPEGLWDSYLEPKYRGVIRGFVRYTGDPLAFAQKIEVGDYTMPTQGRAPSEPGDFQVVSEPVPGLGDAYERYARDGFPPQIYREAMDRSGIDYMVIYPTLGPVRHGSAGTRCVRCGGDPPGLQQLAPRLLLRSGRPCLWIGFVRPTRPGGGGPGGATVR